MTWGTYVHVPWCRRRCPYCAFYVEVDPERAGGSIPWDAFADRLLDEFAERRIAYDGAPATLFFGGGTPSRMPAEVLARIVSGIEVTDGAEVSIEVNPEDAAPDWLAAAIDAGVTRVSLGLQTTSERFARLLNRAATATAARDVAGRVAALPLDSWSLDLIFALPGQTLADLDAELDAIVDIAPPHVALYGLTYEPGTPLTRARDQGRLVPVDDDLWRAMYDRITLRLEAAGLRRYEVSNFARQGHEARHNQLYWTDAPYVGIGPSAHGYLPDGTRYDNVRDVVRYLAGGDPTANRDRPDPHQAAVDLLVSGLRGIDGVDLDRLASRHGYRVDNAVLERLVANGLAVAHGPRLALTAAGFPIADAVVSHVAERMQHIGDGGS